LQLGICLNSDQIICTKYNAEVCDEKKKVFPIYSVDNVVMNFNINCDGLKESNFNSF